MTVEFFYGCSSPFTYLGFVNMRALADELAIAVTWRPILVGGVFNAVNQSVYDQRAAPVPAKASYHQKDIQDWARLLGLTIKFPPSVFPVSSVKAMRGCLLLKSQGKELVFAEACFRTHWNDDLDIGQEEVLARICDQVGIVPDTFFRGIAEASVKEQLRANTDELIRRGDFGSPTMFVDGDDMYFGNDRMCLVREAVLRKRRATP